MSTPTDPAEVARAVARGVSRLMTPQLDTDEREATLDELAGLYAEGTEVSHPFAPLGDRPLRTREELREHFAAARPPDGLERFEPVDSTVHRTSSPELVVHEFGYAGSLDGHAFVLPCVFVMRVRDGAIVESRDYADHLAHARAFGTLGGLADALRQSIRDGEAAPG